MRRLPLLAALLALLALGLPACAKEDAYTQADTEGLYLTAGGLKYQVQLSRELNPALVEDQELLRGIPPRDRPTRNEILFGIWMRVENDRARPYRSTGRFEITDTQDNRYDPIRVRRRLNVLTYRPTILRPAQIYPDPNSVAYECCPRAGALLVFRINRSIYQNRPADLDILSPFTGRKAATVELDL